MEIFRKVLESTIAQEKNKTAVFTRRVYRKQIVALEQTIAGLKDQLQSKDNNIEVMGNTVDHLNKHLDSKKSEIMKLEGELLEVKKALEERDKIHALMVQKFTVQSSIFNTNKIIIIIILCCHCDDANFLWSYIRCICCY